VTTGVVKPLTSDLNAISISLIYNKLGLDRKHLESYSSRVSDYASKNERFPQDPTSNQTFTSEQFVAYWELGHHVGTQAAERLTIAGCC
jgi:hypothetical protein